MPAWRVALVSDLEHLAELGQVLQIRDQGDSPCRHVTELLDTRIDDVDRRIEDLQKLRKDLATLRGQAADLDPADCPPESVCRIINLTS